jgi:ferredoxin--NADP+ reductase
VDGPEFDASLVNFDVLMQRNSMYREKECQSLKHFQEHTLEELVELRAELAEKERELAELRSIPITLNPKRRPMKNEVQNV